jgi:drug/metabolite transporter (DMT)-like permease
MEKSMKDQLVSSDTRLDRFLVHLRLLAVPVIWGSTFVAGRIVAREIPPATASVARYLLACIALAFATRIIEGALPRLNRRQIVATVALGATGVFGYSLLVIGALGRLPASRASLIISLNPIVTIALASVLLGEKLSARRWLGVVIALAGVWVVVSRGDLNWQYGQAVGRGELMMFAAACVWAAYTLIGRITIKKLGLTPLASTTYAAYWGTLLLCIASTTEWSALRLSAFTPLVCISLIWLGVLGTALAFVLYAINLRQFGAAYVALYNNFVPVFGAIFGVLLLSEPLVPSMLIGGGIAVAGVTLTARI